MSCADGGRLRVGGMRVCAGGGGVGGAEEDDSVVSLRCTPACGSVVSHPCRKGRVMDGAPGVGRGMVGREQGRVGCTQTLIKTHLLYCFG
jgi:hypothetical protein